MESVPPISVIMTVFNGVRHVDAAIRSVLEQQLDDFELIIVDDGSEDGTVQSVRRFEDPRVRLSEAGRVGRSRALNLAVAEAESPLIAVLDADDLALRDRLSQPIAYLRDHPEIGIVGSAVRPRIDGEGRELGSSNLAAHSDSEIRKALRTRNPLFHSSVTFRKSVHGRVGGYDERLKGLVDWDFFVRAAAVTQLSNLATPLATKRNHPGQYFAWGKRAETKDQLRARAKVLLRTVRYLGAPQSNVWQAVQCYTTAFRARSG